MKKLSLVLIALFSVGFVFAQNTATVNQYGSNIGQILQTGSDNTGTIQQGFLGAPVTNNHAPAYSGDWIQGSYIEQIGTSNTASATVRTSGNGTSIYQNGTSNSATQDLGSTWEETTNMNQMGLDIDQVGGGNLATQKTIMSFGSAGIKGMTILQQGSYNVANQLSVGGYLQVQTIKQIGDNNNNPTISLNAFDLSKTTLANPLDLAYKFNDGYGHTVSSLSLPMTQYSNQQFGSAIINVTGDNNNTYQFQEYSVWSTSGNNDEKLNITGDNNNVAQGQIGENDYSEIEMLGSNNVASTSQLGDSDQAYVTINGSNNVAGIQQTGNFQIATVLQSGNNNFAKVVQHF